MRRAAVVVASAVGIVLVVGAPGRAAPVARDSAAPLRTAPSVASAAASTTAQDRWVRGSLAGGTMERRYPFTVSLAGRHVVTLGGLSGAADLLLLDAAGHRLATSSRAGRKFDRITRVLPAGSYVAVVRRTARTASPIRFAVRIERMAEGMAITGERFRVHAGGMGFGLTFLLTNNTASAVQLGGVFVAVRDADGQVIRVVGGSCITRRYAERVLGPGDHCFVEIDASLARRPASHSVNVEVGTPERSPVLRPGGLRVTPSRTTACTGGRPGCHALYRRVTTTGSSTVKDVWLQTIRWDAYGRVVEVASGGAEPRVRPGRGIVMLAYWYRGARPRDLSFRAISLRPSP